MSSLLLKISLYSLLLIIAALCVGSPYAWDYPIELLSHFRVYYLAIAVGIAIAAYLGQRYKLCSRLPLYLSLVLIAFNSIWLLPWYMPNLLSTSAAPTARVLTFNVHIKNNSWDDIATAIRTVDPDIATILESTDETKDALSQRLNDTYPNIYRTTGGGITLLSRLPVISADSKTFNNGTVLIANVQIGQKVVELIAAHPLVPLRRSNFTQRNALLGELTTYIEQNSPTPLILLGDFNLTPWSPYYGRLTRKANLHNTRLGFGLEPSWLEPSPYSPYPGWLAQALSLPIDHILISKDIRVANCKTQKAANADHRILWSDLVL